MGGGDIDLSGGKTGRVHDSSKRQEEFERTGASSFHGLRASAMNLGK